MQCLKCINLTLKQGNALGHVCVRGVCWVLYSVARSREFPVQEWIVCDSFVSRIYVAEARTLCKCSAPGGARGDFGLTFAPPATLAAASCRATGFCEFIQLVRN
jgi:hypothetical protein